jgi:hypothetical protein
MGILPEVFSDKVGDGMTLGDSLVKKQRVRFADRQLVETHRLLLIEAGTRAIKRLEVYAEKASKDPRSFVQAVDRIAERNRETLLEILRLPVIGATIVSRSLQTPGEIVDSLLQDAKEKLLEVSGRSTFLDLGANVADLTTVWRNLWPQRLARDVMLSGVPDPLLPCVSIEDALEKLRMMQDDPAKPGEVFVGDLKVWHVKEDRPFELDSQKLERLWAEGKIKKTTCRITELVLDKRHFRRDTLEKMIRDFGTEPGKENVETVPRDLPYVVMIRDPFYLYDGHHRTIARYLRGCIDMEVYLWDANFSEVDRSRPFERGNPDQPRDPDGKFGSGGGIVDAKTSLDSSQTVKDHVAGTGFMKGMAAVLNPSEDTFLKDLGKETGKDGLPSVLSKANLDKKIAGGETEMFRGMTGSAKVADDFRSGPCFMGRGIYGNGIYFAYDEKGSHTERAGGPAKLAESYAGGAGHGSVIRASLKEGAVVKDYEKLLEEHRKDYHDLQRKALNASGAEKTQLERKAKIISDLGRYAALNNVDAIKVKSMGYMVVLNRTAVHVQEENHTR